MSVGYAPASSVSSAERVSRTVALLARRGYAVPPARLAELCLGGPISEHDVRWAVAASQELVLAQGLVIDKSALGKVDSIRVRADGHDADAPTYVAMTLEFVHALLAIAPFIRSVSIAGSLASGGFRATDDVDLNLIVDDGHRHLAYVAVNVLGLIHALRYRAKPVDDLTRRPIAPRLMTANLILEQSQCFPLARQDEDMAFELLIAQPIDGVEVINDVVANNPSLVEHFPQLAFRSRPLAVARPSVRVPRFVFPRALDGAARLIGEMAWRYMQWTRRNHPEALARVAYVRATMRPYTLFDR